MKGCLDETAVLVLQHDVIWFDVGMHNAEFLDMVEGQEKLLAERLDGHEVESSSCSVLMKGVAEIERHEWKHNAEMTAVHETLINRDAMLGVLWIVFLDLLQ